MNNKFSALLGDLDEFQYRLFCGAKLVEAVYDCISSADRAAEEYNDALFAAHLYVLSLSQELEQRVNNEYKEARK